MADGLAVSLMREVAEFDLSSLKLSGSLDWMRMPSKGATAAESLQLRASFRVNPVEVSSECDMVPLES